jgi:hypothetical protein
MCQMRISSTQVFSVVIRPKKLEIRKQNCENCTRIEKKQTKYRAMKLSQIRRRIELCMREIIICFEMHLIHFINLESRPAKAVSI